MSTAYETDVVVWANEQAALLRARKFAALDIEHIADEVEDVGKSEQRELESRMAVLLAHLLKWRFQPERRGKSWQVTIRAQRKAVIRRLTKTPSLKADLTEPEWWEIVWGEAVDQATRETGIQDFPDACPWSQDQILALEFLPA
ncbi:MAG TPA: DUF29 domain-containing protein [Caulobacteraceae bacterium]|nr:DUF29 domain-containing protein [Caulobacteraceae bacterium]